MSTICKIMTMLTETKFIVNCIFVLLNSCLRETTKGNENSRLSIRCYIQFDGDYIAWDKKLSSLVLLGTWILYSNTLDSKKSFYWTADTKVHDECNNAVKSQLIDSLPDSFLTNPLFAIPTPCRFCRNYSTPYPLPDPQCTHRYTTAVLNVVDCRCISVYKICLTLFPSFYVGVSANSQL